MSWGDIFPVLDEAMVREFRDRATPEERAELRGWFGVKRILNRQPDKKHVVSACFFWRHVNGADPELPAPSRRRIASARRLGLVKRFAPWDTYRVFQFARWPDYGLDEWWLLCAVHPRLARKGVLTFAPSDARSPFLPADLEFAQWANPRS